MSKPKFKVGDKVRITARAADLKNYRIPRTWAGRIGIIDQAETLNTSPTVRVEGRIVSYYIPSKWLELVKPEKIIIYRNGAEVVAKNTATGKTGVAKCNPADEFDFNIGAKLAFERLTNPEPVKPKYYTGKVVCVSPFSCLFTKGKVYEIKDGVGKDDDGNIILIHRPKSFAEFSQSLKSKFIELVE